MKALAALPVAAADGSEWYGAIVEMCAAEKITSFYVSRVLRLTLLAPDMVEAILDGRQPEGMTVPALMQPFPVESARQRQGCRLIT